MGYLPPGLNNVGLGFAKGGEVARLIQCQFSREIEMHETLGRGPSTANDLVRYAVRWMETEGKH